MPEHGMTRLVLASVCLTAALLAGPAPARAEAPPPERVRVLVPDGDNLQYLAFWVAQGAGYLRDEGVEPDVYWPDVPAQAIARVLSGEAQVAVLPPPTYLQLIADRYPIELVANLLRNEARKMSATAPLRDRLLSLKGLRIGVAPGPPTRLRALFASEGLVADDVVKIVVRHGKDQNDAFAADECDALYAYTPYVEKALDDQDAVILVNQSAGEARPLAMRQIHALVATHDYLGAHRATVDAMVRAVARAESLVHADAAAAENAVVRALPALERRHVHTIVGLYQPAVPETPRVSPDGLAPALALFPASRKAPSLEGVPLAGFVASDVLDEALAHRAPPSPPAAPSVTSHPVPATRTAGLAALGGSLIVAAAIALARRRRRA
jgi:ABC-type nitrate/sulfonate/bicarbonate transport system substrate-binding protein